MTETWKTLRINPDRLKADFDELNQIGLTPVGGINRPALSDAHLEAREWFRGKIILAGLEFRVDGAGNHSAFLASAGPQVATFLLGSHLDSVPNGGRFDGALGVLAALEVLRRVKEVGLKMPVHLEAIDFTDEEGTLMSFLGSFAFSGKLTTQNLLNPRGGREALDTGLRRAGLSHEGILSAQRNPDSLAGYLELHVEQGKLLFESGTQIGIVTGIAGIAFYRLTFVGRADHAGTISMEDRLDASLGASAFILAARQLVLDKFPGCYANIGQLRIGPGLYNIVPKQAIMSLELRSAEMDQFKPLEAAMINLAESEAERFGLGLEIEFLGKRNPAPMDEKVQHAILLSADRLGLKSQTMISNAGHDAQPISEMCPTGMIFIPSVGGTSHSPKEYTEWEDCIHGANALLQTVITMLL